MLLTGIGLAWVLIYRVVRSKRQRSGRTSVPQGEWDYWGTINFLQFVSVAVVWWVGANALGTVPAKLWIFPGSAWSWLLIILVAVYLALFIYDFLRQLEILQNSPNLAGSSSGKSVTGNAGTAPTV
jgi:hypothetical protein